MSGDDDRPTATRSTAAERVARRIVELVRARAADAEAEVTVRPGTEALTRFANSFIHQNVAEEVEPRPRSASRSTGATRRPRLDGPADDETPRRGSSTTSSRRPGSGRPTRTGRASRRRRRGARRRPLGRGDRRGRARTSGRARVAGFVDAAGGLETAGLLLDDGGPRRVREQRRPAADGPGDRAPTIDGIARTPTADGSGRVGVGRGSRDLDGRAGRRAGRREGPRPPATRPTSSPAATRSSSSPSCVAEHPLVPARLRLQRQGRRGGPVVRPARRAAVRPVDHAPRRRRRTRARSGSRSTSRARRSGRVDLVRRRRHARRSSTPAGRREGGGGAQSTGHAVEGGGAVGRARGEPRSSAAGDRDRRRADRAASSAASSSPTSGTPGSSTRGRRS